MLGALRLVAHAHKNVAATAAPWYHSAMHFTARLSATAVIALCLLTSSSLAEDLRILAWNVESDGNDPNVIVRQLHQLSGYDIVGLTEAKRAASKRTLTPCRPVATHS